MKTNDGSKKGAGYPIPKFRFEVDLGAGLKGVVFQEVTGMDEETQAIEYKKK